MLKLNDNTLKIGIPTNKPLTQPALDLLAKQFPETFGFAPMGKLDVQASISNGNTIFYDQSGKVAFIPMREKQIALALNDGEIQGGVISSIQLLEQNCNVFALGVAEESDCKVVAAVPQGQSLDTILQAGDFKITTSYPTIAANFLDKKGLFNRENFGRIMFCEGSVENIGVLTGSQILVEVIKTGDSLKKAGYQPSEDLLESRPLFVCNDDLMAYFTENSGMSWQQETKPILAAFGYTADDYTRSLKSQNPIVLKKMPTPYYITDRRTSYN